ncbi:MAG: cation:proton antiporter, partial [Myxococcota bacterium]
FAASVLGLVPRLALGVAVGAGAGVLLGFSLRWRRLIPDELDNIFVLGAVLVLFELSNSLLSESGVLAVTVAGVVLGNFPAHVPRGLREFKGALTEGLIGLLFVLLAADVGIGDLRGLGWPGLATVAALMFVVRPLNVAVGTAASDLAPRERAFIAWLAPRGIVAAAIASIAANYMEAHGIAGGPEMRALVFLTIALTVVVQGGLGVAVASLLGVRAPGRDAVLILGAEGVGIALARELQASGRPVVFLDANPDHCQGVEAEGFTVVYGNALEERTLARARPEQAAAVVGLTPNETVNSLFAREAREQFRVPESYVAVARGEGGLPEEILERQRSHLLFDRPKDVARWNVRFRHGDVRQGRFVRSGESEAPAGASETRTPRRPDSFLILTLQRGGRVDPMHANLELREGDEATVVLHVEEEAEALEALATLGWTPAPDSDS